MEQIQKNKALLLNAIEIAKEDLIQVKLAASKDVKNVGLKKDVISKKKVFDALNNAETMADTIKSLIESKAQAKKEVKILTGTIENHAKIDAEKDKGAKTIKVISHRRLRINDGILEYKQIAEIPNNDVAKQCLKSGLISMI